MNATPAILPKSPIVRYPEDWKDLSLDGKRHWLIDDGQAHDWASASSLLSKHGHAMRARRKARKAGKKFIRSAMQAASAGNSSVTVRGACDGCGRVCYESTQHANGQREKTVLIEHKQTKYSLLCVACQALPVAQPIGQIDLQNERRAA